MASNRAQGLQVIDPFLTGIARRYKPSGLVARQLIPSVRVNKLSGQYPIFTKSFWFQELADRKIKDRSPVKEVDYEWSTDTYLCEEYGLKVGWTDLEVQQAESELRFRQTKAEFLTHQMELGYEIEVAAFLLDGAGIDSDRNSTPATNWDQATAVIEENIKTGVLDVYDTIGQVTNVMVIPYKVAYAMAIQEDIRSILHYQVTGSNSVRNFLEVGSRVLPAEIHGHSVVIVTGAQKDTANEGGTESISEIWGSDVRLLYIDANAKWGQPTVAYRIEHTPKTVTRWSTTDPDVNYIRELERYDLKAVAPDAAHVIKAVL